MKGGRGKQLKGPHGKRRRESSGLHQPSEGSQRTTDDALAYLKAVQDIFKNNREKYDEFLDIMEDIKAQRFSTAGVISRLRDLFKGHHSLILGLNTFLPEGYAITVPPEELPTSKQPVDLNLAIKYVVKVKTRFQHDEIVYKTFLVILNMYRKGKKSDDEVYRELEKLFYAHQDLLEEFTRFLADCTGPTSIPNVPASARPSSGQISGETFIQYSRKKKVVKKEKPVTSEDNFRQSTNGRDERTSMEVENERTSMEVENEQWKKVEKEKDQEEDLERKEKDKGEKRSAHSTERELDVTYGHPHNRKSTRRSDESIPKQTQTEQVGGCAGKQSLQNTAIEDSNSLIADVDLGEGGCAKPVKLENCREKDKDYNRELEKENGRIKAEDQESYGERDKDRHHRAKDILNSNASPLPNKEEFTNKPISELNLSNCECCTPSYRLLPKNYTKSVPSYRTDLAAEVLNDDCVYVTYGSGDYSFKHMRKINKYEEVIFRCEDDRFEFDVLIESTAATTKSVKELLENMQNNTIKRDGPFPMEDYLTAINLRCIERIYEDHGLGVLELIRENPTVALPVILTRLQQKQDEWSRCRADMNKMWAEVYAKNYHKSLINLPVTGASILSSRTEKV